MNNQFKSLFLFFISLILLGSNIAQAEWANSTKDCKVWVDDNTTEKPLSWSGQCKDGYASGKGKVIYNYSSPTQVKSCTTIMKKGKIDGYSECLYKTGDILTGTIQNDNIVGEAVYKWNRAKSCPTCPSQYSGTFYNGIFAFGTLVLTNGEKVKLKYHPTKKGCLVWNADAQEDETITWTGSCKDGYANGQGVLTYTTKTAIETTHGTLKNGMLEGDAVVDAKYTSACQNCIVHYDGTFKYNRPIKGVATLGNGHKIQKDEQLEEMRKIAEDGMKFQMAMMQMKRQMAMSTAMADISNQVSCNMSPGCAMEYEYVPADTFYY